MTTQQRIYDTVIARGYGNRSDGEKWTPEELAVRQVLKRIEELAEQYDALVLPKAQADDKQLSRLMGEAADLARKLFDDSTACVDAFVSTDFTLEAADQYVTLAVEAEALGVDYESMAVVKAEADVKRGVRA